MNRFTVTEEHIKLVRAMWIMERDNVPSVDPVYPYGNRDIYMDIARILDILPENWRDFEDMKPRLRELHQQTVTALQILLSNNALEPGEYVHTPYTVIWKRVSA